MFQNTVTNTISCTLMEIRGLIFVDVTPIVVSGVLFWFPEPHRNSKLK